LAVKLLTPQEKLARIKKETRRARLMIKANLRLVVVPVIMRALACRCLI
jgi:hypothetical protein